MTPIVVNPDWAIAVKSFSQDVVGTYGDTLSAQAIVSADYANQYYVVDAATGSEVLAVNPGVPGVNHVTMSHDGKRVYFLAKEAGASGPDLYGCDTLTGANLSKLTSFNRMGMGQPDASPVDGRILLPALESNGTPRIYLLSDENATPQRLTGDETLEVPGADDPTVDWMERSFRWAT